MRLLVTGASGFIGHAILSRAAQDPRIRPRGATRRRLDEFAGAVEPVVVGDLNSETDWTQALTDVDAIVHAAARVHVMHDVATDPLAEFRRVNVEGTVNLARQAVAAGVRRFVYISSIGVNGAETFGTAYTAEDKPIPYSAYAVSKHEAEVCLRGIAKDRGLQVVIVRPPMVFGPRAPGNFTRLMNYINRGLPLPLGSVRNQRSLVGVDNLVDLILTCVHHPQAVNETFLVSDGDDLSTPQLVQRLGQHLRRPARLFPVPVELLRAGAALLGRHEMAQSLCGSLQIDISKTRRLLRWSPPFTVEEELRRAAQGLLNRR